MRRVAVALLLIACSSPPGASVTIVKSSAQPAEPPALRSGPPLVAPGESMLYKLSLQGVELATYQLAIGEITNLAGKQAILVQGHARTTGLAAVLSKIDDRFTSWVDITTGHSLRYQVDELATGNKRDVEHVIVDLAGRDGDTISVTFQLNDGPQQLESQKVSHPVVWDLNAFLLALRSWEAPPGSTVAHEVFRSRYIWRVEARITGKEMVATELGELPALRIDGRTYRIDRKGQRDRSSDERMFTLWISDDDDRVPLAIKAVTDYGALRMRIIDYQPGTGRRLRP